MCGWVMMIWWLNVWMSDDELMNEFVDVWMSDDELMDERANGRMDTRVY